LSEQRTEVYDEKFFISWQDNVMELAKANLLKDNSLTPMVLALTVPGLIDGSLKGMVREMSPGMPVARLSEVPQDALTMCGIPLTLGYPQRLDFFMKHILKHDGLREMVQATLAAATLELGYEKACEHIYNGAMSGSDMDDKDVMFGYIRFVLAKLRALAFCHIHEGYTLISAYKTEEEKKKAHRILKRGGSIRDLPGSTEAIMVQMETRQFARMLVLPFNRTVRDTGKVTDFGELMVMPSDQAKGRMMGMLPRDDQKPATERV
jgi:hypothetical protein